VCGETYDLCRLAIEVFVCALRHKQKQWTIVARRTYPTRIESMVGVASVRDSEGKGDPPDLVRQSDSGDGHQTFRVPPLVHRGWPRCGPSTILDRPSILPRIWGSYVESGPPPRTGSPIVTLFGTTNMRAFVGVAWFPHEPLQQFPQIGRGIRSNFSLLPLSSRHRRLVSNY